MNTNEGNTNPYIDMHPRQYWRLAVGSLARPQDIWFPKFKISSDHVIATAGSCFAQHISRRLKAIGFNWSEAETAPSHFSEADLENAGYGVFSYRVGNIYSSALLRQWIEWAFDRRSPSNDYFSDDNGRIFDPFRPNIPLDGYASISEMRDARTETLSAMRAHLTEVEIFVFTFGLTECWKNSSGETYPICPGTARGKFDPSLHTFFNQDYDDILNDFLAVKNLLQEENPNIKFLLTVSPVPLTATASGDHVLCSTQYSKSVLRAVAGKLSKSYSDIDYFPSFEIISNSYYSDDYYENNRRTVTTSGVNFVMETFLRAIGHSRGDDEAPTSVLSSSPLNESNSSAPDLVCEEALLEQWAPRSANITDCAMILLGDSHMAKLAMAFRQLSISAIGGGIMNGSQWHQLEFDLNGEGFFDVQSKDAQAVLRNIYNEIQKLPNSPANYTIVTNIGIHAHAIPHDFLKDGGEVLENFSITHPKYDLICQTILKIRSRHLQLLDCFRNSGYHVICVTDPPSQHDVWNAFAAIDLVMYNLLTERGFTVLHARNWITANGGFQSHHKGDDWVHGSSVYYQELARKIHSMLQDAAADHNRFFSDTYKSAISPSVWARGLASCRKILKL